MSFSGNTSTKSKLYIQSNWNHIPNESQWKVWVMLQKLGDENLYGELDFQNYNGYVEASGSGFFKVENSQKEDIFLSYGDGMNQSKCHFRAPFSELKSLHASKKKIHCMDVTNEGLAVSCGSDEKVYIWLSETGEKCRELNGHFSDVYHCRFFPSGIVVLTGGSDMQLKVWSAETGKCATTLIGHTRGITDTAFVERGRNFVSSSFDGTLKLWDCGTQQCIRTISEMGGSVNGCAIYQCSSLNVPSSVSHERECSTDKQLVIVAVENGTLKGVNLRSGDTVFEVLCCDAVECCCFLSDDIIACGTQSGTVHVIDIRNTSEPLVSVKNSNSGIHSIMPYNQGFICSSGDGLCSYINEIYESSVEFTGSDCDPIYKCVKTKDCLYSTCRDGIIRKYKI